VIVGRFRLFATVIALSLTAACTDGPTETVTPKDAIRIGSFDFSESQVLAEIYAGAMDDSGFTVARVPAGGPREIMQPALQQDLVDFLPEYLGTSVNFTTLGREAVPQDPSAARKILVQALRDKGISVLEYAPAEDVNEVVVLRSTAEEHDLKKISDLAAIDDELVFGGPPECVSRDTCLLGLEDKYGLDFESFVPLDPGGPLTVSALEGREVDVAVMFSTSPALTELDFTTLEDDRALQPPENIVPVMKSGVLEKHEGLDSVIDSVSSKLSTAELRRLNGLVESETLSPAEAARQWLQLEGIV
jgi:osmoprotectant transport system substrate-binding protein